MSQEEKHDITIEVLRSIRDEIKGLREDTNRRFEQMDRRFEQMDKRFEQMDKRFERIEKDIARIRKDINIIVARFDRDILLMAGDLEKVKGRLQVCEKRLGIQ